MTKHPMAPVDSAWFHIDGPANSAVITSILITATPLDFEKVKALYASRLVPFERFRQRVVESGLPIATPHWEDMPGFAIEQQLHHMALPPPGDDAALVDLLSDIASTPLDRARPLWDVHVVDGVAGGSALITRIHHCIGDGTANVLVARALFDDSAAPPARKTPRTRTARGPLQRLVAPAVSRLASTVSSARHALDAAIDTAQHPKQALGKAAILAAGAVTLAGELLRRPDPPSPLKGEFGLTKRVAWSAPVPLGDVKAIGALAGAKINDVLIAAMTGALRTYLRKRGVDVDRTTVRAMVPVDLRPPERAQQLGNEFGIVLLDLAVRGRTALQRLARTKENMDRLKRSAEPAAALAFFDLLGRVPKAVEDVAVQLFESRASVVMTNVAGPREPLHVTGVPIQRAMFWVPHPGRELGMGISILSYCGSATLSVIADAHLVPDPERITKLFQREFASMLTLARRRAQAKRSTRPRRRAPAKP